MSIANPVQGVKWYFELQYLSGVQYDGSPFRLAANATDLDANSWQPRDTFSRLSDGTSNQLMMGEKFIKTGDVGICDNNPPSDNGRQRGGDCSIFFPRGNWDGRMTSSARTFQLFAIATTGQQYYGSPGHSWGTVTAQFGSNHPGVCNFMIGDGSVRAVSVTTPKTLLENLGVVNDGNAVTLP